MVRLEQVLILIPEAKIQIITKLSSDHLIVDVIDEGIGMTEESQKQVFEKFYRDHKDHPAGRRFEVRAS